MLKKAGETSEQANQKVMISQAAFPAPFHAGLEYSSPARGTWNIVHSGMLIPESHQIFVCAYGCLRGVVLTAAEMNALDRYSSIAIKEENVLDGSMERIMVDGVGEILQKLPQRPKAILLFISCQHFFLAYDQDYVFATLRQRYPDIRFVDCYMIPTLRKSGLTPDQKMRIQMYQMWEKRETDPTLVNHIGSNLPLMADSDLEKMLTDNGLRLMNLQRCHTFDDYMNLASARLNIVTEPLAIPSAQNLKEKLGMEYYYFSNSFSFQELDHSYQELAECLSLPVPDHSELKRKVEETFAELRKLLGDTPIVLDYTFTFRILSLTRFLLEHGFRVTALYADSFLPEEQADFEWLKEQVPELMICATNRPGMRFCHNEPQEKTLALGQKAAYFAGTDYFVNMAECGGYLGYAGMLAMADQIKQAFYETKDRKELIQRKGFGCESCLG